MLTLNCNLKKRGSVTSILCGEYGLVNCMEMIFLFGFKSQKLFKRLYVWDFLGRKYCYIGYICQKQKVLQKNIIF